MNELLGKLVVVYWDDIRILIKHAIPDSPDKWDELVPENKTAGWVVYDSGGTLGLAHSLELNGEKGKGDNDFSIFPKGCITEIKVVEEPDARDDGE